VGNTTWISGIFGKTVSGPALSVVISGGDQLGTVSSSRRFKKEIKPMDKTSEAIQALKPVTFCYKSDKTNTPQFGLVAEEVAAVNPDLVVRDKNGEIYSVRYDAVDAMLLNEFLKEHKAFVQEQRKVQGQEATIAQLKKDFRATVAQLTTRLDEQAAQIQKVGAQLAAASPSGGGLEASKPAPQVVNNP
jgi:septal ring factor EnvC (AmiA/AmiB activator)